MAQLPGRRGGLLPSLEFTDGKTILPSANEIAVAAGGADNLRSLTRTKELA